MSTLPTFLISCTREFLKVPPGYCAIGEYADAICIYTHDNANTLMPVNGKYKDKHDGTLYNTIEDYITKHKLQCIPVITEEVSVQNRYGHRDLVCVLSAQSPDGKWMLIKITDEDDDEFVKLYKVGNGPWLSHNPYTVFDNKQKLDKFINTVNALQILYG